jgi:GDP-D-mannose dehydratase
LLRRSSSFNAGRVDHLYRDPHEANVRFVMHYGDMTDATSDYFRLSHATAKKLLDFWCEHQAR